VLSLKIKNLNVSNEYQKLMLFIMYYDQREYRNSCYDFKNINRLKFHKVKFALPFL